MRVDTQASSRLALLAAATIPAVLTLGFAVSVIGDLPFALFAGFLLAMPASLLARRHTEEYQEANPAARPVQIGASMRYVAFLAQRSGFNPRGAQLGISLLWAAPLGVYTVLWLPTLQIGTTTLFEFIAP